MALLERLLHGVDLVNEWAGRIFCYLTLLLMSVVLYDTCLRYLFNSPTIWGMDLNKILLLVMVCMGGGYAFLHGGHVKVDILYLALPPKGRILANLATHLVLLGFCTAIVLYGGEVAWEAYVTGETSSESAWEYLLWPVLSLVPLAGVLLGLQVVARWLRDLVCLLTGEERLRSRVVKGEGGLRG